MQMDYPKVERSNAAVAAHELLKAALPFLVQHLVAQLGDQVARFHKFLRRGRLMGHSATLNARVMQSCSRFRRRVSDLATASTERVNCPAISSTVFPCS